MLWNKIFGESVSQTQTFLSTCEKHSYVLILMYKKIEKNMELSLKISDTVEVYILTEIYTPGF